MRQFSFEKLEVWQIARKLTKEIYELTAAFPKPELFNMVSQIRRATTSITCNLTEGSGRISGKDKARFTEIAYSSMIEVFSLLIVSSDMQYITTQQVDELRPKFTELGNKLNALHKSQLDK